MSNWNFGMGLNLMDFAEGMEKKKDEQWKDKEREYKQNEEARRKDRHVQEGETHRANMQRHNNEQIKFNQSQEDREANRELTEEQRKEAVARVKENIKAIKSYEDTVEKMTPLIDQYKETGSTEDLKTMVNAWDKSYKWDDKRQAFVNGNDEVIPPGKMVEYITSGIGNRQMFEGLQKIKLSALFSDISKVPLTEKEKADIANTVAQTEWYRAKAANEGKDANAATRAIDVKLAERDVANVLASHGISQDFAGKYIDKDGNPVPPTYIAEIERKVFGRHGIQLHGEGEADFSDVKPFTGLQGASTGKLGGADSAEGSKEKQKKKPKPAVEVKDNEPKGSAINWDNAFPNSWQGAAKGIQEQWMPALAEGFKNGLGMSIIDEYDPDIENLNRPRH